MTIRKFYHGYEGGPRGEVADWKGHPPERLKAMKDRVEKARRLGVEAILD